MTNQHRPNCSDYCASCSASTSNPFGCTPNTCGCISTRASYCFFTQLDEGRERPLQQRWRSRRGCGTGNGGPGNVGNDGDEKDKKKKKKKKNKKKKSKKDRSRRRRRDPSSSPSCSSPSSSTASDESFRRKLLKHLDSSSDPTTESNSYPPFSETRTVPRERGEAALRNEAISLQHLMCHTPKNPFCETCNRAKMYQYPSRQKGASTQVEAKKFGDHLTADHLITSDDRENGIDQSKVAT